MDPETQRALGLTTRLLSEPPDLAVVADPESWALVRKYAKQFGVDTPNWLPNAPKR